jgi:hypothetical protein
MLERLEKRLGATPTVFPIPIFVGIASISWFHVCLPPSRGNTSGRGLSIGLLGQADQSRTKTDDIGVSTAKRARVAWPA